MSYVEMPSDVIERYQDFVAYRRPNVESLRPVYDRRFPKAAPVFYLPDKIPEALVWEVLRCAWSAYKRAMRDATQYGGGR